VDARPVARRDLVDEELLARRKRRRSRRNVDDDGRPRSCARLVGRRRRAPSRGFGAQREQETTDRQREQRGGKPAEAEPAAVDAHHAVGVASSGGHGAGYDTASASKPIRRRRGRWPCCSRSSSR
jgi:hypothetical protein